MEAIVNLVDQEHAVSRRDQFQDDREQADQALAANGKWHQRVQSEVQMDRRTARFREDLDPLDVRLDDPQRVDNILVLLDLENRAELLCDTRRASKGSSG